MRSPRWPQGRALRECATRGLFAAILVGLSGVYSACGGAAEDKSSTDDPSTGETSNGASGSANSGVSGAGNSASGGSGGGPGGDTSGAPGEDGGSPMSGSTGEANTFYRADLLKLIKPQLVLKPFIGPQQDITPNAQTAVDEGLVQDKEPDNGNGIADSGDGDGYVDLNAIIKFIGGVDPSEEGGAVTAGAGLCPFPYDAKQVCGPLALAPFQTPAPYTHGKDCKLDGTMSSSAGSCFSSQQGSFTVNIQLIGAVPLQNAQVIGSWVDAGKGGISNGWIRGFLSEEVAMKTKLPAQIPIAARLLGIAPNTPLIEFLGDKDKQASPAGWWFTLQYTAKAALYDPKVGPDGAK